MRRTEDELEALLDDALPLLHRQEFTFGLADGLTWRPERLRIAVSA